MIKAYTCNNDGTPSMVITPENKEALIDAFMDFLDLTDEDPDIREFHCTITRKSNIPRRLVRKIDVTDYIEPDRKREHNSVWNSYRDDNDYYERDFEL